MTAAVIAALLVASGVVHWVVCRLRRAESTCERLIREAHQRADAAREWDGIALAFNLPAYSGPEPDAALERLRQDITDDQHKGD